VGPEARIEGRVVRYAKERGATSVKLSTQGAMGNAGWPDRMFLGPDARVLFIEFKAPGRKPTLKQAARISSLKSLGFEVEVVDNIQVGRSRIARWMEAAP
jgi:hypothetical protein